MRTQAKVISLCGARAVVEAIRSSACEGCHKNADGESCSVCTLMGGERSFTSVADNSLGAEVGDIVMVESETRRVLFYAVLVFLLPLVVAILGYGIGVLCELSSGIRALCAAIGFCLCFAGLYVYSKRISKRRCDVVITEILQKSEK